MQERPTFHLGYACIWEPERHRTWSGTPLHLLQALEKQERIKPHDIACQLPSYQTLIYKMLGTRIQKGHRVSGYRFMPSYLSAISRRCKKQIATVSRLNAILQIGDIATFSDIPVFTYQDLTVHYILHTLRATGKPLPMFTIYNECEIMRRWEYQQRYYEQCTGIFTMSHWLRHYLIDNGIVPAHKVHTVHAGTNVPPSDPRSGNRTSTQTIEPQPYSKIKTILFVGREFERKGGDIVVEAFKQVQKEYSSAVRLVVAGPQTWASCSPKGSTIPDGIEFLGDADYPTLRRYFASADVFCMPSRFEAFGIVFAEALSFGVPCIGRNAFAMPEIISHGDNGYLLDTEAEGQIAAIKLAELLMTVLDNDAMRENVHLHRAETARYFSWDRVAAQMVSCMC